MKKIKLYTILSITSYIIFFTSCTSTSSYKGISKGGRKNVSACPVWGDNVYNPVNIPYVQEIAFNEDIPMDQVTQEMFNKRYLTNQ